MTTLDLACQAVLFDCDGVLVASGEATERAWRQWAREHRLDEAAVLDGVHGRRSRETVALFLPVAEQAAAVARVDALEVGTAPGTRPVAGVAALLAGLPPVWAVVTSAGPPLLAARLSAAGLPVPAVTVTAVDVERGKPSPEGYLRAALLLGVPVERCVVVEDSGAGVRAGLAAGAAHVLGVGPDARAAGADPVVPDLTGVTWTGTGLRVTLPPAPA